MKINFASVVHESSGYGQFARQFIYALHDKINVSVEPIGKMPAVPVDLGIQGEVTKRLINTNANYDVNVVCWIPTVFSDLRKPNKKNVIFTMWEASALPDSWVAELNKADAVFVPSYWNKNVFEKSGVNVPVFVVHPGMTSKTAAKNTTDEYRFYSIFQWTERKNPEALIKAYFSEFADHDDVILILKSYRHIALNNEAFINQQIEEIKKQVKIKGRYPKILVNTSFLDEAQINNIHQNSDCFVLPHRAEGVGLPHMEAMYHGNPCIATNYSGNKDFMTPENSYLLDYQLTPATNMGWYVPWFDASKMYWADASVYQLAKLMRHCYQHRKEATERGKLGQATILNSFTHERSAEMFLSALNQIKA